MVFHQVWWNCFYFELKTVKKFLKVMAMEAWVLVFLAFPVHQEASFPTFLLKTFHFQRLVLESESRYIVGCFISSTFNCILVFLSHLKDIQRVLPLRAVWNMEKTVLHEIRVSVSVLCSPTNANFPTYTYTSKKTWCSRASLVRYPYKC